MTAAALVTNRFLSCADAISEFSLSWSLLSPLPVSLLSFYRKRYFYFYMIQLFPFFLLLSFYWGFLHHSFFSLPRLTPPKRYFVLGLWSVWWILVTPSVQRGNSLLLKLLSVEVNGNSYELCWRSESSLS